MDLDGHNYERSVILEWIQQGEDNIGLGICPISHKPLQKRDLIPNTSLKETIHRWCQKHGFRLGSLEQRTAANFNGGGGSGGSGSGSGSGSSRNSISRGSNNHCDLSARPELCNDSNHGNHQEKNTP